MIVLDTKVLSELVRGPRADGRVARWVRGVSEQPVTTVPNRAELLAGAALLAAGRRRDTLVHGLEGVLADLSACLPFTVDCAGAYAEVRAVRHGLCRPFATMDALIAAVALVNEAGVATRDVDGFSGLGLRVVDPWSGGDA